MIEINATFKPAAKVVLAGSHNGKFVKSPVVLTPIPALDEP